VEEIPGDQDGGIAGLVAFLREHGAAIEADLQHHYGVALSDLTTGRLSWRRLKVLIDGLPRTSNLVRAIHGDDADWGIAEHLLALNYDAAQVANWQRSADGAKGRNRPKPFPRPGVKKRLGKTSMTPAQARAYLARLAPKREVDDAR
jgi:hypothetical protein